MRAIIITASLALAGCVSVPGAADAPRATLAQTQAAADFPTAIDLPAGAYRLDPRHASVRFRIRHLNIGWFSARFDTRDATLTLDPADPTRSSLTARIDAASVNTGVLSAQGERGFDAEIAEALGGGDIRFVSTAIERTGRFTARVTGDLTLNGQTHPASLDVTYAGGRSDPLRGGVALGFSARGVISRSAWGVSDWSLFAGDEVELIIDAELVQAR